ncbi:hypothetical protein TNCT_711421 [Trichonephila clavata]|uniref:Uncharacterized protein n=1 Tax=Trichonephila clavata TaxID=2740835 RepID=A0A8X6J7G7_TRICU|nr:hypothetical protein TNCT_711421 [Trichonephila clavata]
MKKLEQKQNKKFSSNPILLILLNEKLLICDVIVARVSPNDRQLSQRAQKPSRQATSPVDLSTQKQASMTSTLFVWRLMEMRALVFDPVDSLQF